MNHVEKNAFHSIVDPLIKNILPNCPLLFPNEILVGIIIAIVVYSLEKRRQFMKFRDVFIFDMRKSNVGFDTRVGESLYSNKTKLMFDGWTQSSFQLERKQRI